MNHYLKAKYTITNDKRIKDEELINLIEERDEIYLDTQVVYNNTLLEVVEINEQDVWWEIKEVRT